MSEVLVKGMEMPKNCKDCRFWMLFLGRYLCFAQNIEVSNYTFEFMSQNRLPNCPLVEVKPHGKLKDFNDILTVFDKVIHDVDDDTNALLCDLLVQIQYAPTVLEESKGDDDGE